MTSVRFTPCLRPMLVLAVVLALASTSLATTVERQSLDSLAARSELIVRGIVEDVQGFAESPGRPYRIARLRVTESLAGVAPAVVALRLPGGMSASGEITRVAGVPDLAAGDDLVVFLSRVPEVATRKAFVPAGAVDAGGRGRAVPATSPPPIQQWSPLSLAVGTYRVVLVDGVETAVQDPEAGSMRQVGPGGGPASAPAHVPLRQLARDVNLLRGAPARAK